MASEDVTEVIAPTLELGRKMHLRYGIPVARLLTELARQKAPILSKLVALLLRRKLREFGEYVYEYLPLQLQPDYLRERVKYSFYLLRGPSG